MQGAFANSLRQEATAMLKITTGANLWSITASSQNCVTHFRGSASNPNTHTRLLWNRREQVTVLSGSTRFRRSLVSPDKSPTLRWGFCWFLNEILSSFVLLRFLFFAFFTLTLHLAGAGNQGGGHSG